MESHKKTLLSSLEAWITQKFPAVNSLLRYGPICVILICAAVLYFYDLGYESFWFDELYSVNDSIETNTIPWIRPFYYVLLHGWMQVSGNDAWLRGLSIPFGLGTVLLTYLIGRKAGNEATGLISAVMVTLSPVIINFVQMVRMYSLGNFLALLGSLALIYALSSPSNRGYKILWVISRFLLTITAPLNSTLLFADAAIIVLALRKQPKQLLIFSLWFASTLLLWSPFLFLLITKTLGFLKGALDTAGKVTGGNANHAFPSLKMVILRLRNFTAFPFPATSSIISFFYQGYTLVMLGLLSLSLVRKRIDTVLLWSAIWIFVPATSFYVVSRRLWIDRYLLFLVPFVCILLASGFLRLWHIKRSVALGIVCVYLVAVSGGLFRYYSFQDRQDWRALAQIINDRDQPSDIIITSLGSPKMTTALRHYYSGDADIYSAPSLCSSVGTNGGDTAGQSRFQEIDENIPPISSRVWLVCGEGFTPETFDDYFGDRFTQTSHWYFTNENFYRNDSWMHLFLVTVN